MSKKKLLINIHKFYLMLFFFQGKYSYQFSYDNPWWQGLENSAATADPHKRKQKNNREHMRLINITVWIVTLYVYKTQEHEVYLFCIFKDKMKACSLFPSHPNLWLLNLRVNYIQRELFYVKLQYANWINQIWMQPPLKRYPMFL